MKKRMRVLALVLTLLMCMTVLTACGDTKTEEASDPVAEEAAVPVADAAGEGSAEIPQGGDASATTEAPAEFSVLDPKGDYTRDWAGYQAYLTEACNAEAAFPDEEMRQQVKDQIAAAAEADYDAQTFPYQMLIGMNIAVSYEEFLAA